MEQTAGNFNRFAIPVRMGIVITIVKMLISTIQYQFFLGSFWANMGFMFLSFVIGIVLFIVTGTQQRKAYGGFIDFKSAFQAIFVAILISVVVSYCYDLLYMEVIDPNMIDKIAESSMAAAEKMGAPQERLDDMAAQFERQKKESLKISEIFLALLKYIVMYGIVGFICAAIVKKDKPQHLA
ncbi:MAG: DUF4199 domain-containing protein [Flavipsychrobacter sp.]